MDKFFILTLKNEKFFIKADDNNKDFHLYSTRLVFEFYILLSDKNYKINDFKLLSETSQKILNLFKHDPLFKLHFHHAKKYLRHFFCQHPKKYQVLLYELKNFNNQN